MTPRDQGPARATGGRTTGAGYRPELQGLRALAVVLVVIYHVWVNRVSGGVDVFFVVSGFLLTGQLVRAAERGDLDVRRRWSRTLLRLTPAAAVVLTSTAALAAVVLPEVRWYQTVREVVAAALYLENWQLAADSVDYAARNNTASIAQHFWSLSVQGQFFLLWPLLIALVALACRHVPGHLRRNTTLVLLGVFAASLVYSIELTATNQPLAYFHTLTRLWEFALGGLLALHGDRIVLTRRARVAAGWTGVLGLVACGALIPVATVFPGIAALWPTGCAALVLLAGQTGTRAGADRLLSGRVARYLGDISYALYLWHWPLLVLYLQVWRQETPSLAAGAMIIGVSLVLAVLTYEFVERPVLRGPSSLRRGYRVAATGTAAVVVVAATWQTVGVLRTDPGAGLGDPTHPGALALVTGEVDPAPLLPSAVTVAEDWVPTDGWECSPMAGFPMDVCAQPLRQAEDGGEDGAEEIGSVGAAEPEPPAKRILVVGDSHAHQLMGTLIPLAEQNNWQLMLMIRGACPFSTVSEIAPDDADCLAWNEAAAEEITALRPDAVVTMATRDVRAGLTERTPAGFVEQWRRLDAQGIPVLAMRDNPRFDYSVPDCVQTQPEDIAGCGVGRAEVYPVTPPWAELPDIPPNVSFVDIADAVCDIDRCPPVIGNVLVYMDDNHLSGTYIATMAELLEGQIQDGLGW